LNLVAPLEDDGYHKARPRIALKHDTALPLDGFFGLHPLLKPLHALYEEGTLALIHAAGSEDDTRSHFEAQDLMEHGGIVGGGWLGRFLRARPGSVAGPLGAVVLGRAMPESLRGAPSATVMESFDDFLLGGRSRTLPSVLAKLYEAEQGEIARAGRDTLGALRRIEQLRSTNYTPAPGADYGDDSFSRGLVQIARLIKARVGLEAASVDLNGWDSHASQGALMDPLMTRLATGLAAFRRDLGGELAHVTVVVMTEFGRRLAENSAFGTDHGRGSVMFVLGGGIRGGRVLGAWPGLKDEVLEGPGDLPVTTNYRNVLAPLLLKHSPGVKLDKVFPQFALEPLPLFG
jgi:uncharacterized protein (DUF1501 family)